MFYHFAALFFTDIKWIRKSDNYVYTYKNNVSYSHQTKLMVKYDLVGLMYIEISTQKIFSNGTPITTALRMLIFLSANLQ